MTLLVKPEYYDFFIRSMVPMKHYWPIRRNNKCRDLKFAVEWGNNNTEKVSNIKKRLMGTSALGCDGLNHIILYIGTSHREARK